jgi:TolB-like protein
MIHIASIAWMLALGAGPVMAQSGASASVALVPLETLGSESKVSQKTQELVAKALASVPGHAVVPGKDVRRLLTKNSVLRACDGKAECLARLGKELGARYVVFGEVGGLGSAEVVYLKLVEVGTGSEVRSTTLELDDKGNERAASAAAFRLLAPDQYMGTLATRVDADGASIYVDGQRVATSPSKPLSLSVGTHAVRITHPEFRDFVRFVDIEFQQTAEVEASLQQFPIVASDLAADPDAARAGGSVIYQGTAATPWYRTWYTAAGVGAVAFIASAVLVGVIASGIDVDGERIVDKPR